MSESKPKEIRLLDQGRRGIFRVIFSRTGIVVLLFLVGVALILLGVGKLTRYVPHMLGGTMLFQFIVLLALINSSMDATGKNTWMLVIAGVPFLGALFYIYTRIDPGSRALRRILRKQDEEGRELLPEDTRTLRKLREESPGTAAIASYVAGTGNFPVFRHTDVRYFPLGEEMWESMLKDLENARDFIFLEFFIIGEGTMWGRILDVLARKAALGVEVRVMYDGTCEFSTLTRDYPQKLAKLGIRARAFSSMTPFVSTHYNNRDHRKIMVIDGKVAYNGGVNLADEYINVDSPYGHWKDTAVRLEGPAVDGFTNMFLEMWGVRDQLEDSGEKTIKEVAARVRGVADKAAAWKSRTAGEERYRRRAERFPDATGYVIPYGDNPLDEEKVGENVYMDFLYRADRYVYIMSPYLILDDEMMTALRVAAQKGVDVRIILPGIPDKKMVYALAKSYFARLVKAGVKIYLYTPGFVHAKVFISDDNRAVVGTINLDYRSLYHHFECATYLYKVSCIADIRRDMEETLDKCMRVTEETMKAESTGTKVTGALFRMIAPLL